MERVSQDGKPRPPQKVLSLLIDSSTPIGVFRKQFTRPLPSCHFRLSSLTHSLTHAFLPVFCHTFNSDANSDYNFFHSLSPSYLRPFLVLLPKPLSSGSKSNIILQPTRKLALPQKGGRESEGFVSLESSKEIIFETNFAKGEQNPLEEKEEEENRPIV